MGWVDRPEGCKQGDETMTDVLFPWLSNFRWRPHERPDGEGEEKKDKMHAAE